MNIEHFADLLRASRAQGQQQRLLFVFANAELPENASAEQRAGFDAGVGGTLVPAMCVDKSPDDVLSFESLVQEAAQFAQEWRLVFVGALSGTAYSPPDPKQVEVYLQAMVDAVQRGDLGSYLAFDREGITVTLT